MRAFNHSETPAMAASLETIRAFNRMQWQYLSHIQICSPFYALMQFIINQPCAKTNGLIWDSFNQHCGVHQGCFPVTICSCRRAAQSRFLNLSNPFAMCQDIRKVRRCPLTNTHPNQTQQEPLLFRKKRVMKYLGYNISKLFNFNGPILLIKIKDCLKRMVLQILFWGMIVKMNLLPRITLFQRYTFQFLHHGSNKLTHFLISLFGIIENQESAIKKLAAPRSLGLEVPDYCYCVSFNTRYPLSRAYQPDQGSWAW